MLNKVYALCKLSKDRIILSVNAFCRATEPLNLGSGLDKAALYSKLIQISFFIISIATVM